MQRSMLLKLSGLLVVSVVLSACGDEAQQAIDNLLEDPDYSNELVYPQTQGANCPNWQNGQTVVISASTTLPANCAYNQVSIKITKPNVEFNCNGTVFNGIKGLRRHRYGNTYTNAEAPVGIGFQIASAELDTTRLQNITIRNCQITNYIHGIDIRHNLSQATINGLKQGLVSEDTLRLKAPSNIKIVNTKIINSHGSGIYTNRYVTYLALNNTSIKGSGGPGLYLDAGTRYATVSTSLFEGNGFSSYEDATKVRSARRSDLAKREGIAIDASGQHTIQSSSFKDNGDGGIYLYKNCWENYTKTSEWPRLEGANNNKIEANSFFNETVGIWVAERADRDLTDFNCGDNLVLQEGSKKYYRDYASGNIISNNKFDIVKTAIKIMDDNTIISGNTFSRVEDYDIDVGSRIRQTIGDAVSNTNIGVNTLSKANSIRYQYGSQ